MHKPAIPPLVWGILYPNRCTSDPATLQAHVSRYIVPEVQEETIRYYGPDGGLEAQYPGLDYTNPRYRKRLSWFPHHRRLFQAFDELRLSSSEIKSLCRWEGTLYSKEKFEREAGTQITDSAWPNGNPPPTRTPTACLTNHATAQIVPNLPVTSSEALPFPASPQPDQELNALGELEVGDGMDEGEAIMDRERDDHEVASDISSEDDTISYSIGVELNQRLLAATAARARGEEVVLDADWEQWLKEAAEWDANATRPPFFSTRFHSTSPSQTSSNSRTNEIPGIFHDSQVSLTDVTMRAMMPPPPPYVNQAHARVSVVTATEGAEPQVGTAI